MSTPPTIPAAQYLRMSTEHQRYSLAAQAKVIAEYAATNRYEINRTYFDPGESGLTFENRKGLQALLAAALDPVRGFDAILVLDVSRWGRFQDVDQAASYEYLCRSAGVRVIYCAEPFGDDAGPVSSLLKAMKRIMAAEFSRELSAKAQWGRIQQARLGHFVGGGAVYGVRRVVVGADGQVRTELRPGERKAFVDDRVVLRPGPPHEQAAMRYIFRRYVRDRRGPETIARELNAQGLVSARGRPWGSKTVIGVLQNELAIGIQVANKSSRALRTRKTPKPAAEWVRTRLFPPLVSPKVFRAAQARLALGEREKPSKPEMLKALRKLLRRTGRLNARLINYASETLSAQTYRRYFGSLNTAYALVGYVPARPKGYFTAARREPMLEALREAHARHGYLTAKVVDADPRLPVVETYTKQFGSLSAAYALAGLPHHPSALLRAGRQRAIQRRQRAGVLQPLNSPSPYDNGELLRLLHAAFVRHQGVSKEILDLDPAAPGASLYKNRFGSLARAYVLAQLPSDFLGRYRLRRFVQPFISAAGAGP